MNKFAAQKNAKHYEDMLLSDIGPTLRSRIQNSLIDELDKLENRSELLNLVDQYISRLAHRIGQLQSLASFHRCDIAAAPQPFLDSIIQSHWLLVKYRRLVADERSKGDVLRKEAS